MDMIIDEQKLSQALLLVSHMPFVSYYVDTLLSQEKSLLFATAAIAVIDYNPMSSKGTWLELHTPK